MPLVIENGTGVAGAEAWADDAAFQAWEVAYYGQSTAGTTVAREASIRRAVAYMNALAWKGSKTLGRAQSLAWPRTGVIDCDNVAVASNEIPAEIIFAQHVLARAETQSPGVLSPSLSLGAVAKRNKVDVIEQEFDTSRLTGSVEELRPVITMAMDKLKCFLAYAPGGKTMPWAVAV